MKSISYLLKYNEKVIERPKHIFKSEPLQKQVKFEESCKQ